MLGRLGADKGPVPRDELLLSHALALVGRQAAADLTDVDEADAVCGAAGVGAAAVAVTLEGCRRKEGLVEIGRCNLWLKIRGIIIYCLFSFLPMPLVVAHMCVHT